MQWLKHDTNANQDAKLKRVRMRYGMEGYGLYWYCLELIAAGVDQNKLTFELEHDAEIIGYDTGMHPSKVSEMMAYMVDVGLFECANNTITCLKLLKRLDQSMTSNKKMRELIVKAKESHDAVMIRHDSVMMKSDFVMQEETRREEIKDNTQSTKVDQSAKSLATKELLDQITQYWNDSMKGIAPKIDLLKKNKANVKRIKLIEEIIKTDWTDEKFDTDYRNHEYWAGYISRLATSDKFQWQRENNQLCFDQAMNFSKFERNLGLMRMEATR